MKRKSQTKTLVLVICIFVGIVAVGVTVYLAALREPPPRQHVFRDMLADFVWKLHLRIDTANQETRLREDDLALYIYNPPIPMGDGKVGFAHQKGDPRPPGDLQRIRFFNEEAVVLLNLRCENTYPVFDRDHQNEPVMRESDSHTKIEACPHANHFYYHFPHKPQTPKETYDWVHACARCGHEYKKIDIDLGYDVNENIDDPEGRWYKDIVEEDGRFASHAVGKGLEIANQYGVSGGSAETNVLGALEYRWIKWPEMREQGKYEPDEEYSEYKAEYEIDLQEWKADWENTLPEDRWPLGFRGVIRFVQVARIFDPMPRINRVKDAQLVRYDKISDKPPEDAWYPYGYTLWRTNHLRILEVDVVYRDGNVTFENWDNPRVLAEVEPFHRSAEALKKGEEIKADRERKLQEVRSKKKPEGGPGRQQ